MTFLSESAIISVHVWVDRIVSLSALMGVFCCVYKEVKKKKT